MQYLKKFTLLYVTIGAVLLVTGCKESEQETVPDRQTRNISLIYDTPANPVLFEITSTGCPGCGGWGKPAFTNLVDQYNGRIVPMAVHIKYEDPFITYVSQIIADNRYGSRYTPQIWVNDSNGVVLINNSINTTASINRIHTLISNYRSQSTDTIAGAVVEQTGDRIRVRIGVKNQALSGSSDYFLNCYFMRDSLTYEQNGAASNPQNYNYVIRKSLDGPWGRPVVVENGVFEYEADFAGMDPSGYYSFAVILWQKVNNRYIAKGGYHFR